MDREASIAERELVVAQKSTELQALQADLTKWYHALVQQLPDIQQRCRIPITALGHGLMPSMVC
jgi:hypothetical protein